MLRRKGAEVRPGDRSGYMAAFLSGMRWEAIPTGKQGQVAADIRKFRRELRDGGYSIE